MNPLCLFGHSPAFGPSLININSGPHSVGLTTCRRCGVVFRRIITKTKSVKGTVRLLHDGVLIDYLHSKLTDPGYVPVIVTEFIVNDCTYLAAHHNDCVYLIANTGESKTATMNLVPVLKWGRIFKTAKATATKFRGEISRILNPPAIPAGMCILPSWQGVGLTTGSNLLLTDSWQSGCVSWAGAGTNHDIVHKTNRIVSVLYCKLKLYFLFRGDNGT